MELGWFYEKNSAELLPSVAITAGYCDSCDKIHGWQLALQWLWFGIFFNVDNSWDFGDKGLE